jgi:hypothetical protein
VFRTLLEHLRNFARDSRPARPGVRHSPAPGGAFRPRLEALEDRTVLSSPATHFLVLTPPAAFTGQQTEVEVVALDASNHRVFNYTGTVQLTSTDPSDALPANYTFTARDHGEHDFLLTPGAVGSDTVTATDTTTSSLTGDATLTVNPAPVATHFLVLAAPQAFAGQPTSVLVVALDASNHRVFNYTGTVQLTSTDPSDTLPANYTFTSSDHGAHLFSLTPAATGSDTITATDTSTSSVTGSVTLNVTPAPVATHFLVVVPRNVQTGQPTPVFVAALDASNHLVPTYTGTVQLTSSDSAATLNGTALPATYTFMAVDHGIHVFWVTFGTTGSQTVTVTDTSNGALTGVATALVGQPSPFGRHHDFFGGFGF